LTSGDNRSSVGHWRRAITVYVQRPAPVGCCVGPPPRTLLRDQIPISDELVRVLAQDHEQGFAFLGARARALLDDLADDALARVAAFRTQLDGVLERPFAVEHDFLLEGLQSGAGS